ncbi:outer membrane chaperone Skp (OmpH) [Thermosinus carboxydivorans Nor1]|uniref:Outer membrane chaperone Skp (OmpH) n=1 Tax=Thermosinus carboxydivorans Nor1 TaxID=401526 RepID=A1HU24_9FIRM|nr:OmpH family outer membrane protein [Thermosinus carboxydivorans]EAX46464.1 outer membrane chaperone Skp (OmpH) [Thermosinus carboxydivorans Nor1]
MFKDKKQVKFVAFAVAVVFLLGIAAVAVTQTTTGMAAAAGSSSNIGIVNYQMIVSQHPDMAKAQEAMQAEVNQAQKDFDSKAATMNDKEKQDYYMQLQQRLNLKQQELVGPVFDKVNAAIKAVADAKGLTVVLDKNQVIYGGQDITDEVMKKIGAAK